MTDNKNIQLTDDMMRNATGGSSSEQPLVAIPGLFEDLHKPSDFYYKAVNHN